MTLARASPIGIRDAVAEVDLRGVVRDEVDLLLAQERLEVRRRDVGLDEPGLVGETFLAPRREVVHDDDTVAVGEVPFRHVRADEAGPARHEDVHRMRSFKLLGMIADPRRLRTPACRSIRGRSVSSSRPRASFAGTPCRVARDLLGAWIARRWRGRWYGARIVETEAYLGPKDRAAHSWNGRRTPRVEPMYADGGHLYVFLVYGMHHCANVVTRREGVAEAVLLRAAEGPGRRRRRGCSPDPASSAPRSGSRSGTAASICSTGSVRIFVPVRRGRRRVAVSARVGIDYAGEARHWPLRFYDGDSRGGFEARVRRGGPRGRPLVRK